MDIITSHNSLDFDGLASMVAAGKLYPSAVKVLSGSLSQNVKQFMGLYKHSLEIRTVGEVEINNPENIIIVDARSRNRLGRLRDLDGRRFIVFDHHPSSPDDVKGNIEYIEKVGATTTILVEMIKEKGLPVSSFEATILALGIYEDTGSLLFSSTTDRDAAAVAFLLGKGANLSVVNTFVERPFSSDQRQLMQNLLATMRHYDIHGLNVAIASCFEEDFVPGLSTVVHRLAEVESCDALIVAAEMQGRINVVARSRTPNIEVNRLLEAFGGQGHEKAAAAVVRHADIQAVIKGLLEGLEEKAKPGLVAQDIMSTPVKSVAFDLSMEEAGKTMLRYGHTGMPVVDGDRMIGVISRRDVDKARLHDLGHAPVKGFMSRIIVSVSPDTPISEVQSLMVERDIGRVPVTVGERLVGIISRTDILRTLHGDQYPEDHAFLYSGSGSDSHTNCRSLIDKRLPKRIRDVLEMAGATADRLNCTAYCIGGFVRDLFLHVPNFDVDLVIEGNGLEFAHEMAMVFDARVRVHERFKTAVIILQDGSKIDVATARTEYYEFPAALPRVEGSSIKEDLYRRDFTINTMAICLNPGRFGELIDFFGGQHDLNEGLIRILYNLSFVEDPTRIMRAIRFEQRLKFSIEPDTLRFAHDAIARRLLGKLSYKRIQQELILILGERDPVPALRRMHEIGVWQYVLPEVKLNEKQWVTLRRIPRVLGWLDERQVGMGQRTWVVYLEVLLSGLMEEELQEVLAKYPFDRRAIKSIAKVHELAKLAGELQHRSEIRLSELDRVLTGYSKENMVFLLLCLDQEWAWEVATRYLEARRDLKVETSGSRLKQMGIPEGPVYQQILSRLRAARLDGEAWTGQDELDLVQRWIEGGQIVV